MDLEDNCEEDEETLLQYCGGGLDIATVHVASLQLDSICIISSLTPLLPVRNFIAN